MPGLTPAGLEIATLADVRDQINTAWRGFFGASMDVSDRSPDGQQIGIVAEVFALLWQLLEAVKSSRDPNQAVGAFLVSLTSLVGTKPVPASFSTVTLALTGTPSTVVPNGSLVSATSTGQQFTTDPSGPITIVAAVAWAGATVYSAGQIVKNSSPSNSYRCLVGGISNPTGGPTTKASDITDGSAHWQFMGVGAGVSFVIARATVTGPIVAVASDIVNLQTSIGGWTGVINLFDATLGADAMTDGQLRVLWQNELARPGTATQAAIRAALLDVGTTTGNGLVTSATVFMNVGDSVDVNGLPGHSVLAMVSGGDDQEIWDTLLANVGAGIRTFGTQIGTSTDANGQLQEMAFSRVGEVDVWVKVTLTKDPNVYPDDGDAQVAAAIATLGNARPDGTDVTSAAVLSRVFTIVGLADCALPLIGTAPVPTLTTTISISLFQRAVFDTSRITVLSSDAVP